MEDLDFTRPARSAIYDPAIARACFESLGRIETFPAGAPIFAENQASDRMYLLLEGEVRLLRGTRSLDIVKAGEIFGELAVITGAPRSAGAVALGDCRAASLDAAQFEQALARTPEFALMLMSILMNRLRMRAAIAAKAGRLAAQGAREAGRVFGKALLEELADVLKRAPQSFPAHHPIMREGEQGGFMYLVLGGSVAVSIKSKIVERIGPGGAFGEMALIDQSARSATVAAETDASLLPINRTDFLLLVKSRPAFAISLLKALAERLQYMT
jgi:CRP-like cAMP-binding protein